MVIDANRIFSALIAGNGVLFDEDAIGIGSWTEAWRLCRDVDENDTAYLALTLELDAELWTSDRELETGLRKKGFTRFFQPQRV